MKLTSFNYFDLLAVQVLIAISVDTLPLPGGMGISEILYLTVFEIIYGGILINDASLVASAMLVTRAVSFYIPLILSAAIVVRRHIALILKKKRLLNETYNSSL